MNSNKYNLTIEEIKKEIKLLTDVENKTGFLYFCENYIKVSHPSKGAVRFKDNMFNWQKKAAIGFVSNKQVISKKSRQTGFSTLVSCYALWRALFFEAQNIQMISIGQRESTDMLRRLKFSYEHLPGWIKQKTDELAKTTISFEHNGSKVTAIPRGTDAARGGSLSLLIVDEFGSMDRQQDLLAAALPALSAGMLTPFTNKSLPSQLFVISTLPTNPINNEYLRLLHNAQDNPDESKFHLIDVDTSDIPQYQDEEWHKTMRESLGDRMYKIEILGIEVYDMEDALIPSYVLETLKPVSPIRTDFLYPEDINEEGYYKDFGKMLEMRDNFDEKFNYIKGLWIWEDSMPKRQYVVCVDVATGRSGDWSTMLVIDPANGNNQVAEYVGKVDTETFKAIIQLVCEYYNKAKLSIENTGLGGPVTEFFATTLMYQNLYWHRRSKNHYSPGFPMSSSTRANAIAIMQTMVIKGDFKLNSVRLINELRTFGYTKAGRIEAIGQGNHDDIVMALCAFSFLQNIGWAVTDDMAANGLMFGEVLGYNDEDKNALNVGQSPEQRRIKKFWEETHGFEIDQDTLELMEMAHANGCSLADINIAEITRQWKE